MESIKVDKPLTMTQEEKQPQCLYGRTYKERQRACEYCSAACPARISDFDTEVYNWLREHGNDETRQLIEMTARHFWEMGQNGGAMLHIADKSYKMGRRDERFKLMKDAVEGIVIDEDMFGNKICVAKIPKDSSFKKRGLVKVIILKEEDEK